MRSRSEGVLHDQALCGRAQGGDPDAQTEVLGGCDGLIRSRIDHVIGVGRWPANVSLADAEQEARLALFRALLSWDRRRPLTTLAVTCIDRQLRRWRAQTFPVLHISRAAYAAAHGHVPLPASLDAPGDGDSRPLAETVRDRSLWGRDPLAIVEELEAARERLSAIADAGVSVGVTGRSARRRQPRSSTAVRTVVVRHVGSSWGSLCFAFAAERHGTGRFVARLSPAAPLPVLTVSWRPLRLNLDTHAA